MSTAAKYDRLWAKARPRLLTGDLSPDRVPDDGDPRWGLSLVVIPGRQTRERLAATAHALGSTLQGQHRVYDADDLHLTITSLEPYRDTIDSALLDHYAAAVERDQDVFDIRVQLLGVGGSPAGVFAQGFDNNTLHGVRVRMRAAASAWHNGNPPAPSFVRDTAHISLNVFRHSSAELAAVEFVDAHRTDPLGDLVDATVALVRYRSDKTVMRLQVLRTFR